MNDTDTVSPRMTKGGNDAFSHSLQFFSVVCPGFLNLGLYSTY